MKEITFPVIEKRDGKYTKITMTCVTEMSGYTHMVNDAMLKEINDQKTDEDKKRLISRFAKEFSESIEKTEIKKMNRANIEKEKIEPIKFT